MFFRKNKKFLFLLFSLFFLVFGVNIVLAQVDIPNNMGSTFGLATTGLKETAIKIIQYLLGFLGILAISLILYGGFLWMTSGGNPQKIEKAKKTLIAALIGLAIILTSFVIVKFVANMFGDGSGGTIVAGTPCDCVTELNACAPSGCLSCQNTATPGVCTYQADPASACPGCSASAHFVVTGIQPPDTACPVSAGNTSPRNSIIRISFNKPVDSPIPAGAITVESSNTQCPAGTFTDLTATGTFTVNGNVVEFRPASGTCSANSCGADHCFSPDSTIHVAVNVGAGGPHVTSGGVPVADNIPVDEDINFFTNNLIDCQKPTLSVVYGSPPNSQLCINIDNNISVSTADDSGVANVVFSDSNGNAGFTNTGLSRTVSCPGPGFCGNPAPWNFSLTGALSPGWHPLNSDGFVVGNSYTIDVVADDLDSNSVSDTHTFTLRANHCCNGTQDSDEEGMDCGGADCAGCIGAACGDDMNTACTGTLDCQPNNDMCSSDYCGCTNSSTDCAAAGYNASVSQCCICQGTPIIDCVTPNDKDDCSNNHTPVGTTGNLLTIWGRNFGTYVPGSSRVLINGNPADIAGTINADCVDSWTDTQIVVVVPAGSDGGVIEVVNKDGQSDTTDNSIGTPINNFNDNGVVRPGLCHLENNEAGSFCFGKACGSFEDAVISSGINILAGSRAEFGGSGSFVPALNSTPVPNFTMNCQVPNLDLGDVGYSVLGPGGERSNYLNFTVKPINGGPVIDFIDPKSGPTGEYITINGSNFGNSIGKVYFKDPTSVDTLGDFGFPATCPASKYWTDSYIIVKVPSGLGVGAYNVRIQTSAGDESNEVGFDVCSLNNSTCPLHPGICNINPGKAPAGFAGVNIYGENFGNRSGNVQYYNGINATVSSWNNTQTITTVPGGAETGPVVLTDNLSNDSNGYPFEVGTCTNVGAVGVAGGCPAGDTCCADGTCRSSCAPNFSTYTWSFTTGDYFVREECDPAGLDPEIPSPSPWNKRSGGTDVCLNAAIGASFKDDVDITTLNQTTVIVKECGGGDMPGGCGAQVNLPATWTIQYLSPAPALAVHSFYLYPNTGFLNNNTWYQITLTGGTGGLRLASGEPLIDDYVWYFKTGESGKKCEIRSVKVLPNPAKLVHSGATQDFTAILKGDDPCIVLNPSSSDWLWNSTDRSVATITGSNNVNERATAVNNGKTYIEATETRTNIKGSALLTVDFQGLNIINHFYECDEVCPNAELGLQFNKEVDPNTLTTGDVLAGNNIGVYQCSDGAECHNYAGNLFAITGPRANYFWNLVTGESLATFTPVFGTFSPGEYYRVVVRKSNDGIKSVLGAPLESINANLAYGEECDNPADPLCDNTTCLWTGNACGTDHQECVNDGNSDNKDGCSDDCLHEGSTKNNFAVDYCGNGVIDSRENCDYNGICVDNNGQAIPNGNTYYFCQDSVTNCTLAPINGDHCEPIADSGCSNCLLQGSSHTAICGNGKIEFGEACDDGNQTNGDGCNSHCLREGRSAESATGFTCGNGNPERNANGAGEDCDDGNLKDGDGCSSNCLSEGDLTPSVCGDGKIGLGEDCDGQLGCDPTTCLWKGSQELAVCGNNIVEKDEPDYYSWVFKVRNDTNCTVNSVDVLPSDANITISGTVDYRSMGRGAPDSCDPRGQSLNPWSIDWRWTSDNATIASISTTDSDSDSYQDPFQTATGVAYGDTQINAQAGAGGVSGSGDIHVGETAPPGTPCVDTGSTGCCNVGVSSCSAGYTCLSDNTFCLADTPPTNIHNCRCCCDPLASEDPCPGNLTCHPNIYPCTSGETPPHRGMCCGCENDSDCAPVTPSGDTYYCGNDTCCYPRPEVTSTNPANGDINVCRNAVIVVEFNQKMNTGIFDKTVSLLRTNPNPGNPCSGDFEEPIVNPSGADNCAVKGRVYADDTDPAHTVLKFSPREPLDSRITYMFIINGESSNHQDNCGNNKIDPGEDCDDGSTVNGDGCSDHCLNEGTDAPTCGNGVIDPGEDCDDGSTVNGDGCSDHCLNEGTDAPTCGNGVIDPGEDCDDGGVAPNDGCSDHCLNEGTQQIAMENIYGINMVGDTYSFSFTTGDNICDIDRIKVNLSVGDGPNPTIVYDDVSSDMFICAGRDDCRRDYLQAVGNPGNQHHLEAIPIDDVTGNELVSANFDWIWTEYDPNSIFELPTVRRTENYTNITGNPINGNGYVEIRAESNSGVDYGSARKRVRETVFLCENPWPSIDDWPWGDNGGNCTTVSLGGTCQDTNFELYYCRDAGGPGPMDDLPAISDDPVGFGSNGDILKELFFIQDKSINGGPNILNASITPCIGRNGTDYTISVNVTDIQGVNSVVAHIQSPDESDIDTVNLACGANNICTGTWTDNICSAGECSYFVDIVAEDNDSQSSELENINCVP